MQPLNGYLIVEISKDYSGRGLIVPSGEAVYFYEHGLIALGEGRYAVKDSSIFVRSGKLCMPAAIVQKAHIRQSLGFITMKEQEWFTVVQSTIPEAKKGDVVIIRPRMYHRFHYGPGKKELTLLLPHAIMIIASDNIIPGPAYEFVEEQVISYGPIQFNAFKGKNKGCLNGEIVHYHGKVATLDLDGKKFHVVPKENIYAKTNPSRAYDNNQS